MAALGLARLGLDFSWAPLWLDNLRLAFEPGGANDLSVYNFYSVWMINLKYPVYNLVHDAAWASALTALCVLGFGWVLVRRVEVLAWENRVVAFGGIALLNLLAFHHRAQDGILLAFLFLHAVLRADRPGRAYACLLVASLVPFLVPGMTDISLAYWAAYSLHGAAMAPLARLFCLLATMAASLSVAAAAGILAWSLLAARPGDAAGPRPEPHA